MTYSTSLKQNFQQVHDNFSQLLTHKRSRIESYTGPKRLALNYLIRLHNRNDAVYPSQTTIAQNSGVCRQTMNEMIGDLVDDGMIYKQQRFNTSCLYDMGFVFSHPVIRRELSDLLPSLKSWPSDKTFLSALLFKKATLTKERYNYKVTSSCKSSFRGDEVNKDFKNMARREEQSKKKETGPPPMTPYERERKRLELEARYTIGLRDAYAKIEAEKARVRQQGMTDREKRFLENNPEFRLLLARSLDNERENASPPVPTQKRLFPTTGQIE